MNCGRIPTNHVFKSSNWSYLECDLVSRTRSSQVFPSIKLWSKKQGVVWEMIWETPSSRWWNDHARNWNSYCSLWSCAWIWRPLDPMNLEKGNQRGVEQRLIQKIGRWPVHKTGSFSWSLNRVLHIYIYIHIPDNFSCVSINRGQELRCLSRSATLQCSTSCSQNVHG